MPQLFARLTEAFCRDDAELVRACVERIGLAVDRGCGTGNLATNVARSAMFRREQCHPAARIVPEATLVRLAVIADLIEARQIAKPDDIEIDPIGAGRPAKATPQRPT